VDSAVESPYFFIVDKVSGFRRAEHRPQGQGADAPKASKKQKLDQNGLQRSFFHSEPPYLFAGAIPLFHIMTQYRSKGKAQSPKVHRDKKTPGLPIDSSGVFILGVTCACPEKISPFVPGILS
jgi:hypothetical protein